MKNSSVCLLLGVSLLLLSGPTVYAVSLSVSPNLQQFFSRQSKVTLSCDEGGQTADGWTVKRTAGGRTHQCGGGQQDFGRIEGSFCIISNLLPSDSGVYWCESSSGQSSEQINITVTDGQMILEIPALPVLTGSDVMLRSCFGSWLCGLGTAEYPRMHFAPTAVGMFSASPPPPPPPPPPTSSSSPPPPPSLSAIRLFCHLVVVCPYCISTVLMVSIYCSRRKGNTPSVSMEMTQHVGGGQGLDDVYDDIAADVTTEHDF